VWWCWLLVSTATLPTAFTLVPRDGPSLYVPLMAWSLLIPVLVARALSQRARQGAAAAVIASIVSVQTVRDWREKARGLLEDQRPIWSVITQIRALGPAPDPNTRVIFMENPLPDWNTYFIARLLWRDRSIEIGLANKLDSPPTEADLNQFAWILTFENGNLRVRRKR